MDANALKQLSRAELQKLAKSNNIKANGKSQALIEQLIKKYPEGVPKVAVPGPRASSRPTETLQRSTADSETESDTNTSPEAIASGPATPEAVQRKGPRTSTGQSASSPNRDASGHGYRFGQPSASITGRRIAGGGRVSRYLATPRVSATQAGDGSSSSPQLATPDALAKLVPEGSIASHEKPLSWSSQGSSRRRRNIPAPDRHDGPMENSRTPQSGVSSSSSFPNRETPSPAPEREGATEAQAKAMLCALRNKVGELNYWRNELASAQYVLKQANERNKAIQEKIVAVQKHRKVAERFYMAAVKKDERLHNGAKTWKPQEPGQPERDYSYVAEESEEQDTSDFVADSDESRPSGSLAENAEGAVDGEVKVGDEQQVA